ncbi:MAG: hypothetical protein GXY77_05070, partial [Fibrobacter sp.]|nr:hypothetical protein [Fibrobacter sp.]
DNVARNWGTIRTSENGLQRLKKIHEKVLQCNKEPVIDPVYVKNKGLTVEYMSKSKKRENYLYCNGYVRLDAEIDTREPGLLTGTGILFKVSDNVNVFYASSDENNMFDTSNLLLAGIASNHLILRDYYALRDTLTDEGIWLKGINGDKQNFYFKICSVRLPVLVGSGIIKIDTAFSLTIDEKANSEGEINGTIMCNEKNIVKIFPFERDDFGNAGDIINNVNEPCLLLHGHKRYIEVDSSYFKNADNDNLAYFAMQGEDSTSRKILVNRTGRFSAELQDTSPGTGRLITFIMGRGIKRAVFFHDLDMWHLAFKYIENGLLTSTVTGCQIYTLKIAPEDHQLPDSWKNMGKIILRRSDGIRVYSDNAMTNEIFFSEDTYYKEIPLDVFKSNTYIGTREQIYLYSERGGLDTLSVSFKIKGNEYFTETVRVIRIKPHRVSFMNQSNSQWSYANIHPFRVPAKNTLPVRYYIEMGNTLLKHNGEWVQYPSEDAIREKFNLIFSFYGGNNSVYPEELCRMDIFSNGLEKNGADVEIDGYKIKVEIDPSTFLNAASELEGRSKHSIDIYTNPQSQYSDDADAFDNNNGLQFGKSRQSDILTDILGDEFGMISPVTYHYGTGTMKVSFDYIYNNGQLYINPVQLRADDVEDIISQYDNKLDIWTEPKLPYPKTAEWFFHSGHGLANRHAGLFFCTRDGDVFDLNATDEQYGVPVKEILKQKWAGNVNLAILNSCYNASVHLESNSVDPSYCDYPSENDIWNDDPSGVNKGLHNHIFKWFEMLGNTRNNFVPNTAVLGWGRSKIDGVAYGARDNTGQSPSDRIKNRNGFISFTGPVMEEWNSLIEKESNPNGIYLARSWIEAVIEENEKKNNEKEKGINLNCHNAISIGTDSNGICKIFMINSYDEGDIYSFTIKKKESNYSGL